MDRRRVGPAATAPEQAGLDPPDGPVLGAAAAERRRHVWECGPCAVAHCAPASGAARAGRGCGGLIGGRGRHAEPPRARPGAGARRGPWRRGHLEPVRHGRAVRSGCRPAPSGHEGDRRAAPAWRGLISSAPANCRRGIDAPVASRPVRNRCSEAPAFASPSAPSRGDPSAVPSPPARGAAMPVGMSGMPRGGPDAAASARTGRAARPAASQ